MSPGYYSSPDCVAIRIAENQELLVRSDYGVALQAPVGTGSMLQQCQSWRTIADHASAVSASFAGQSHDPRAVHSAILHALNSLGRRGFLVKDSAIGNCGTAETVDHSPISVLGLVTADRSTVMARCLRGFADVLQRFPRSLHIIIGDGLHSPRESQRNRKCANAFSTQMRCGVEYFGHKEKTHFARELV